jgi:hypothetical protein
VPERLTNPTGPGENEGAGMKPILLLSTLSRPGQFGPIRRVLPVALTKRTAPTMSWIGMPSVTQTIRSTPASAPSITASAAKRGGTITKWAFAPVASTASATVSKMGTPRSVVWPPLPGVTPATTCVRP